MSEPNHDDGATPEVDEPTGDDVQAELASLRDQLQRVMADYANYQKRAQRDTQDARQLARADLIKDLLPVLDDMERALDAARSNHGEDDPLFVGMQLVHDKAMDVLGKAGLTVIDAVGKPFDPGRHAAVMQQPSEAHPPQTVLEEVQKGYAFNDRTIRPASVVVSVQEEEPPDAEPAEDA